MGVEPNAELFDWHEPGRGQKAGFGKDDHCQTDDAANPNGSLRAIAGVSNAAGNVAGLMPHPERASEAILGSEDGFAIVRSLVESAERAAHGAMAEVAVASAGVGLR